MKAIIALVVVLTLAGCGTLRGMRCTEIGIQQAPGAAHTVQCVSWGFEAPEIIVDIGAGKARSVPETEEEK